MKLSKLFVIALLAGTLAVIGCGDDGGGNGNGNGNGNNVCDNCTFPDQRPLCEARLQECAGSPDCPEQALFLCSDPV